MWAPVWPHLVSFCFYWATSSRVMEPVYTCCFLVHGKPLSQLLLLSLSLVAWRMVCKWSVQTVLSRGLGTVWCPWSPFTGELGFSFEISSERLTLYFLRL